jgi:hypothetical protein
VVVTSIVRNRVRALGIVTALAMSGTLVVTSAAFGAADPVQSGTLKLKLSSGFKKQLKSNHVGMKPRSFSLTGGTLDPVTGAGTVNLKGKLTFKKGSKKVVYKKLTAKIGSGGYIKGKAGKVFKLKGGTVVRDGFGADISNVKLKFLKGAAKAINKKLGLHSLHKGSAGTASANNVQPSEVTLVGGSSDLVANLGTFAKFGHHCVSPANGGTTGTVGIQPIAPATEIASPPTFTFPIAGGTLSPAGTSGAANAAGGIQITQNLNTANIPTTGANCNLIAGSGVRQLKQTDLVLDLNTKQIQAHIVISGTNNTSLDGDKGTAFIGTIDLTGATVTADASTRKITITNAAAAFNATSAVVLNGVFPCDFNSGFDMTTGCTGPNAFVAGDPIGTVSLNAQAQ